MLPAPPEEHYAFASFRLYPGQRTLLRDGKPVIIGGRAYDVLLLLVTQAGIVVSLKELMCFVWPNVTVDEANLRVQMGLLRKVLSQCDQTRRAIDTISARGYCFILPVRHHSSDVTADAPMRPTDSMLPILLNPTIGREEAIDIIGKALDVQQLVTVTGPGGIGKTTVGVEVATRYAALSKGRVAFVDLSIVANGLGIVSAIVSALGLGVQDDPLAAICEHLRDTEFLLVLDTCEHIVEPIARLAEVLRSRCSSLRLLVTSREALRASGEWLHRLPPLRCPEQGEELTADNLAEFSAINLFVDRVRASMRFGLQDRDLPVIAEICRRLDGNPLALEFAAARVADLGLRRIAANLDDRFAILTRGRRTALPRHRTLAAALDWSFSLLSDDEQRLLRYLAGLGGSFTAECAVAGGGFAGCARPTAALDSLYEKSLLTVDIKTDAPLYRLLDTTRAYVVSDSMNDCRLSA